MDVLQDQLARARSSGGVFARSTACPPWGMSLPGTIALTVHVVLRGRAYLWLDDPEDAAELRTGELALVPGGGDHHLAHDPRAACLPHEEFLQRGIGEASPEHPDAAVFMCGAYRFPGEVGRGLVRAIPPLLVVRPQADDSLHAAIALISHELTRPAPGQQTVLDRLLDLLVVFALRAAFEHGPTPPRWFHAANDPRLGPALHAIHSRPEQPWTVPQLAALSGLSRPAFARNFERALGQSPMRYLTDWRMTLARDHLRMDELSLTEIAERVGYGSTNAFATAFHRHHGDPPGTWRTANASPWPRTRRPEESRLGTENRHPCRSFDVLETSARSPENSWFPPDRARPPRSRAR
jgi:AraC-like DNA-binding protein